MFKKKKKQKSKIKKIKFWLYLLIAALGLNFAYQVWANPLHTLSFFSAPMRKTPGETWKTYRDIFVIAQKPNVSATLLAALAQVESQGNPLAAPAWKVQFSLNLSQVYAPASSAFGLMQITKGTFKLIQDMCQRRENFCPHPAFSTRARPRDSVILVSTFLQNQLQEILGANLAKTSESDQLKLAAVIHLCGPEVGKRLAKQGFRLESLQPCGGHWPGPYVSQVREFKRSFELLQTRQELEIGEDPVPSF